MNTPDARLPEGPGLPICPSAQLAERGAGVLFDVLLWGQPARAFALRIDGQVVAYVNRCAHVPVELDWQPGQFLDAEGRTIVCAVHGASYAPETGHCIGGPCGRGRLIRLDTREVGGEACWYPSRDVTPVPPPSSAPTTTPTARGTVEGPTR